MPDPISFILQGTDGLSPVVDQAAGSVGRLDAAGRQAFTRLVSETERWNLVIAASERELSRLNQLKLNSTVPAELEKIDRAMQRQVDVQLAANSRMEAAERQWAITAEQSASRVAAAHARAAQQHADFWTSSVNKAESKFSNFATGMLGGALMGGVLAAGSAIVGVFSSITDGAEKAAGAIVSATSDQQNALVTYARQLGSVTDAYKEMATVKAGAVLSSRELPEVIGLDQLLLARFKSMEAVEQSSGRAFGKVRKDILDTGAALRISDEQLQRIAIDLQEIQSGQNVGRALQSLSLITGITKDQLAEQGVQFDKAGTHIVSSYNQAFQAVLTVMESRFGGMDELQSRTFAGMMSNVGDLGRMFASSLGEKGVGVATRYLSEWIETLTKNPNMQATLDLWGDRIGRLTEAAFRFGENMVEAWAAIGTAAKPVIDLIGGWIDTLPAATDGMDALMQRAAASKAAAASAQEAEAAAAQSQAEAQAALEKQQVTLRRNMEDRRYAAGLDIQGQRDLATASKRAAEDARTSADLALQPLKDKIDLLDRIYEREHKERDLAKLNRDIARDTALSKDVFSPEGRAAGLRLVGEEQQKADLIAEMSHTAEKSRLQDQEKAVERNRDATVRAEEAKQRTIEDRITVMERSRDVDLHAMELQQRTIEDQLTAMRDATTGFGRLGAGAQGAFGLAQHTAGMAQAAIALVSGETAKLTTGPMSTLELKLKAITEGVKPAQQAVAAVVANVLALNLAAGSVIGWLWEKTISQMNLAAGKAQLLWAETQDVLRFQDPTQDPLVQGLTARQNALAGLDRALDAKYQTQWNAVNAGLQTGDPAAIGRVLGGQPATPGKTGADVGGSFGTQRTGPTPPPPTPNSFNTVVQNAVHVYLDGKEIKTIVRDEFDNPMNAGRIKRTLAAGGI